jgi:hypothetical protein
LQRRTWWWGVKLHGWPGIQERMCHRSFRQGTEGLYLLPPVSSEYSPVQLHLTQGRQDHQLKNCKNKSPGSYLELCCIFSLRKKADLVSPVALERNLLEDQLGGTNLFDSEGSSRVLRVSFEPQAVVVVLASRADCSEQERHRPSTTSRGFRSQIIFQAWFALGILLWQRLVRTWPCVRDSRHPMNVAQNGWPLDVATSLLYPLPVVLTSSTWTTLPANHRSSKLLRSS